MRVNNDVTWLRARRHEHEWKLWETTRLPEGKLLIPGVIDSTTNFIEHPELVAERIVRFGRLVGAKNVIAGTDRRRSERCCSSAPRTVFCARRAACAADKRTRCGTTAVQSR
jgi:hypothetical protein